MPKQIVFDNKTQRLNVIQHYKRMIKWAKKNPNRSVDSTEMLQAIGERCTDRYCVLCRKYNCEVHVGCPLVGAGLCCTPDTEIPSWYEKMIVARTWKDFAVEAQKFLDLCITGTYKGARNEY